MNMDERVQVFAFLMVVLSCGCASTQPKNGAGGTLAGAGAAISTGGATGAGAAISGAGASPANCSVLATALNRSTLLVGASAEESVFQSTPFDVRYIYLAGKLPDGSGPCTSCASNCAALNVSCANPNGCAWWGCWQSDQIPPGATVRDLVSKAEARGQIPMVSYYIYLQSSGETEGVGQVNHAKQQAFMSKYFNDYRFFLQQLGNHTALLHIEPDLWGYAQQANTNPQLLQAAVATANSTDCASETNDFSGFGKCLVKMTRKYAPNAKFGFHASAWATKIDVALNKDINFDIASEAKKTANYLLALGAADSDYVVVEVLDRDQGYYEVVRGQNRWWDVTNQTLPNYQQGFKWAKAIAETVNKPLAWWQLPVGNMTLNNTTNHYKANTVDYFFSHLQEVVETHAFLMAFGAGAGDQTTPQTDGGNLVAKTKSLKMQGAPKVCNP